MTVLGALEAIRPVDEARSGAGDKPIQPGDTRGTYLATTDRSATRAQELLAQTVHLDAERAHQRALRRVDSNRTSNTLAALAQTYAALGQCQDAVEAAREAMDLSVKNSGVAGAATWVDAPSARIAADVLLRCGDPSYAYDSFQRAPMIESLSVAFAEVALALGKVIQAEEALEPFDGPTAVSFRGFIHAYKGDHARAVKCLRQAVNEDPADVDSILNLAISLWNLGSTRKATQAALRATRLAPSRKDASLLYLDFLLDQQDTKKLSKEIGLLKSRKVVPDAKFLEIQACALLLLRRDQPNPTAIRLLSEAAEAAKSEGDQLTEARTRANLVRIKYALNRLDREQASRQLVDLMAKFPRNDAVAVNLAAVARTPDEASELRKFLSQPDDSTTPIRRAYLWHQVAMLEGDNDGAGKAAIEWFELEPNNPMAAVAAIVAVGIGQTRWLEAIKVAEYALEHFPGNTSVVNNAAYVLAMGGRARDAIRLLEPIAGEYYVLKATLGLAYLALGDIDKGMRLYRNAAEMAEKVDPELRSLMTAYQALVVRQLGLVDSMPQEIIAATSLVPVALPDGWEKQPDFLRLHNVCVKNGYDWPLSL